MIRTAFLAAAAMAATPALAQTDACSALANLTLADATVTAASFVKGGTVPAAGQMPTPADMCRVSVTARPTPKSDVRIEVWLPANGGNGKFLQVGNGGLAGQIPYRLLGLGLGGGYATAGTDDGHHSPDATDASWALGHPERVTDFGYRAVKATTDVGKAVFAAWKQAKPAKSYFFGCSDGGREALMTAQRYPADFDGIVAGAPAYNWTALMASAALIQQKSLKTGRFPAAKLPLLQAAALSACAPGKPWIADPRLCRFDPVVLACKGTATDQCLTRPEVSAARTIYNGARNPATGEALPGLKPGAEALPGSWKDWLLGAPMAAGNKPSGYAETYFAYVVRGDVAFRIDQLNRRDFVRNQSFAGDLNATNPDLSAFKARGGKLIQYHGWNDPAISPEYSIAYHKAVTAKMGKSDDFYRLFMVPGMLHCIGGASPTGVNWIGELNNWVERGTAPATITARSADGSSQTLSPER